MIDIDRFKTANDHFGHAAGDEVLKCVASISTEIKRSPDIVARIGGDELAMVLPETDFAQANAVARRLHQAVAKNDKLRSVVGAITLSIFKAPAKLGMSRLRRLDERSGPCAISRQGDGAELYVLGRRASPADRMAQRSE